MPDLDYLEETYVDATLFQQLHPEDSKVLGVWRNPHRDRIIFDVADTAQLAALLESTKRNVVSTVGKFYNPIGFLSPVIIPLKILFQKLSEHKVDWDELLPDELMREWKTPVADLKKGRPLSFPTQTDIQCCYLAIIQSPR